MAVLSWSLLRVISLGIAHLTDCLYFRLKSVKKEMEIARRKEAEETAALEEVVQMVEQNLEKSTVRNQLFH